MGLFDNYQWVLRDGKYDGCVYSYLVDGVDPLTKKTAEQYRADGFFIVSDSELDALIAEYENSMSGDWHEITEEQFEDALNILPPRKWHDGGFYACEAYNGTLHSFYQEHNGKYYASLQSIHAKREDVLQSLYTTIAEGRIKCA